MVGKCRNGVAVGDVREGAMQLCAGYSKRKNRSKLVQWKRGHAWDMQMRSCRLEGDVGWQRGRI